MDSKHKMAVLAIGTEVTSGQILNSNSKSLSERVSALGFEVVLHMTVPDESDLIQQSLEWLSTRCRTILITGGLGPTTDDITRKAVADFCGKELIWDESAWGAVVEYLNSFGRVPLESHKQQCFFPSNSKVLKNKAGTANGFIVKKNEGCELIVLPGPPSEIESIWNEELKSYLQSQSPHSDYFLKTWMCLGKPESELEEIAQRVFKGLLESEEVKLGYRIFGPYVELKAWFQSSISKPEFQKVVFKVEEELKPWLKATDGADLLTQLVDMIALKKVRVHFVDKTQQRFFSERILSYVRKNPQHSLVVNQQFDLSPNSEKNSEFFQKNQDLIFLVFEEKDSGYLAKIVEWTCSFSFPLETPFKTSQKSRAERYATELAFEVWSRELSHRD
jgi:nicotinamide-nucleotide amidase